MLRQFIALSAFFLPAIASAQCPTGADLAGGITITYNTGEVEKFTSGPNGQVFIEGFSQDGDTSFGWVSTTIEGAFESSYRERAAGYWHPVTDYRLEYDFDISAAAPLRAGAVGGGAQTMVDANGSEIAIYSYSVHAADDLLIDNCTYAALDVYQTYWLPDKTLGLNQLKFMPELGFGFMVAKKWPDSPASQSIALTITVAN